MKTPTRRPALRALRRRWGRRARHATIAALRRAPISSRYLGPPKGLAPSTAQWLLERASSASGTELTVVYPARKRVRQPPMSPGADTPWQFEAFYGGSQCTEPSGSVLRLAHGRALRSGTVITADDRLLGDVSRELIPRGDQARHSVLQRWRLPRVRRVAGRIAVLGVDGADVYWHWMMDLLPRILLLQELPGGLDAIDGFVVGPLAHEFQRETLAALGVPRDRLLDYADDYQIEADELLVPSVHLEVPTAWAATRLRAALAPLARPAVRGAPRRIYLSRRDARRRRVLNDAEVAARLAPLGFNAVCPGEIPLARQAALLAGAEMVVAPHGSGLTNLLFCAPGTRVLELFSPNYVNPCYWVLSDALGLDYGCTLTRGAIPPPPPPGVGGEDWFLRHMGPDPAFGMDLQVDTDALVDTVRRLLPAAPLPRRSGVLA